MKNLTPPTLFERESRELKKIHTGKSILCNNNFNSLIFLNILFIKHLHKENNNEKQKNSA